MIFLLKMISGSMGFSLKRKVIIVKFVLKRKVTNDDFLLKTQSVCSATNYDRAICDPASLVQFRTRKIGSRKNVEFS